jgi:hypothetical protein
MPKARSARTLCLALAASLAAFSARAADDYATASPDQWRFSVAPYAWLPGIHGEVTLRGLTAKVSSSFEDIWNHTDQHWGLMGQTEAWKGDFGGFADIEYFDLGANNIPAGPFRVDVSTKTLVFGFGLMYHVGDVFLGWPMADGRDRRLRFDATAGGRYTNIDGSLDPLGFPGREKSAEWADPVIGGRVTLDLTNRINAIIQADVGGTSTSDDFTWSAQGVLGYRFALLGLDAHALGGYRVLTQNFANNGGAFRWNVTMRGPVLGLNVRF